MPSLVVGAAFFASAVVGLVLSRGGTGIAALWPANAVLLAGLIVSAKQARWPQAAACLVAGTAANLWAGAGIGLSVVFGAANVVSAGSAFLLLMRAGAGDAASTFETAAGLKRFLKAVVPAVASGACVAAGAVWIVDGVFTAAFLSWITSDLLGMLLITPLILTSARHLRAARARAWRFAVPSAPWPLLALLAVSVQVFAQSQLPLLFLPLAALLVATYLLGTIGAVVGTLIVAGVGTAFLAGDTGPIAVIHGSGAFRIQFLQFYLAVLYGTCLPLATLLSERARLAREREDSDRRHRRILDRSRQVIFETDLKGRWTYLNPAWEMLTGQSVQSTIGRSFLSSVAPEDRQAALERLAPLYACGTDECRQDLRHLHADGGVRWSSVRSRLLTDPRGETVGTFGTIEDVTDRVSAEAAQRESDRLYRLLADNSNDMIVRFDLEGVRQYVSPASRAVLGFTPDELMDQPATGSIHPDDRGSVIATCRTLLQGEENPICAYRQRHRGGHYVWLEASYRLIRDDATGLPLGFIASVRDVGRRTAAELERSVSAAKLEEANRLLLMAEQMGGVGHWRVDVGSGTAFWSRTVCAIHGMPEGYSPPLEAAIEAYHPDDRATVARIVAEALSTGRDYRLRARIVRPDGEVRHVLSHGRCEVGPDGATTGLCGVFQDVTEAHEAEALLLDASEALAASNRMLTMAEAVAHVGHWRVDRLHGTHFWSDEVFRIHGLPKDFVPSVANSLELYHEEDRANVMALVTQALSGGHGYSFQARIVRPDGELAHVSVRADVDRDADGAVTGLFGIVQDVTEQARAEELLRDREARFRLITEQASDIIAIHGMDGACAYMSPAARSVLGYDPDELLGARVHDYAPAEDHARLDAYGELVRAASDAAAPTLRFRMRHANGGLRWMEVAARRVEYEGRPCVLAVVRDVTDQVQAEDSLREARKQAEAAVLAKSSFLANMSHEIRTPMNGVVGFTELLLASDLDPEQRRQTELIADSSRAMMRLLNDILDLSKVEAGQMRTSREPFDPVHALKACLKLVAPAAGQKGLELRCELDPLLPPVLMGDGLRLRQIILNLLGNAAKFTLAGAITLRARIAVGDLLLIEVEDTGIGIAADRQAAIFEQFVQADGGIASRFGGSGLGLSISDQLARLMGGKLKLESSLGQGTRFTLSLPLEGMHTSQLPARPARVRLERTAVSTGSARILVAEDHDVNQLLITAMLEKLGCVCDIAENGARAVEMVEASFAAGHPYALVLMDMQMPGVDGLEASRLIRAAGHDASALPIVALTANAYEDDVEACLSAGMQAHLAKPLKLDILESVLRRWIPSSPVGERTGAARFSAKIQERYLTRKLETLQLLDALVRAGSFADAELGVAADMLHKLAGTAEMFGDVTLGIEARLLENGLSSWDASERMDRIVSAVEAMQQAA